MYLTGSFQNRFYTHFLQYRNYGSPMPVATALLTPSRKGHKAEEGEELYLPLSPLPSYSLLL